ncbi:hypothetical protein B0H16DRAFT_1882045 [Mycena metata]|uniref:Uncharacterized protein n=1 Tax=Mycena metata TaxID=1033252 RepID=A0AAD7JRW4_9AGAR|nr:hypothetical protein B0H16DRAFT_1882045 [Mycena metata]
MPNINDPFFQCPHPACRRALQLRLCQSGAEMTVISYCVLDHPAIINVGGPLAVIFPLAVDLFFLAPVPDVILWLVPCFDLLFLVFLVAPVPYYHMPYPPTGPGTM